ncbi:chloride channel [Chytriomyces sp. MP71]|nr:chloride channel [Chytriomyces sp. MP71]
MTAAIPPGVYTGARSAAVRVSNPFITLATGTGASASSSSPAGADWTAFSDRRVGYDDFTTIDWIHDEAKDRLRARELRAWRGLRGRAVRAWDGVQAWIVVLLIGAATGLTAGVIDVSSIWLNDVKEGYCSAGFYLSKKFCCWHRPENDYECIEWIPWASSSFFSSVVYTFFCVVFATLAAILVKFYAPYAAGEGIPEIKTILGGFVIKKFLGGWTLLIKTLGIALSVGSGLSLGKEGPLVHIACCFGNILPRLFKKYRDNEAKKRHLLSASSAAGVSVAFGAPIGGVLFALEEVSYYFPYKTMWRSFFCAMVGAIVLRVMNPFRTGKLVWFEVKLSRKWHGFELPAFILLGVLGGLFGASFIRLNTRMAKYRKQHWNDKPILEVVIVALITGFVGFSHVYLRVSTVDLVANLFRECADIDGDFHGMCDSQRQGQVIFLLLFAAGIKFFLTVVTFGTKIPAGIFTPSIAIGALVGRALGILLSMIQSAYPTDPYFTSCTIKPISNPCITPATYSIIGAAAFLSGTTRITMSLTVIMFELTGALSYVLPIMVTVLTAKWVGDWYSDSAGGLYGELIQLGGYPFIDSGDEYIGTGDVGDIMTRAEDLKVIPGCELTVEGVEKLLLETRYKGFPVVVGLGDFSVVGFAGRAELRYAVGECSLASPATMHHDATPGGTVDMRQWINPTPMTVAVDFPVSLCVEFFKKMGVRYVLVTERESGVLAGIVTKKDLLRHVMSVKDRDGDVRARESLEGGVGDEANLLGARGIRNRRPVVTSPSL